MTAVKFAAVAAAAALLLAPQDGVPKKSERGAARRPRVLRDDPGRRGSPAGRPGESARVVRAGQVDRAARSAPVQ